MVLLEVVLPMATVVPSSVGAVHSRPANVGHRQPSKHCITGNQLIGIYCYQEAAAEADRQTGGQTDRQARPTDRQTSFSVHAGSACTAAAAAAAAAVISASISPSHTGIL